MKSVKQAKEELKALNKRVIGHASVVELTDAETENYYHYFRVVFCSFLSDFEDTDDDAVRVKLIHEVVDLNGLYAIQIKANKKLPPDLADIAHDFDNPDYPGYRYVEEKVVSGGYRLAS
jgi:hypothetical protein